MPEAMLRLFQNGALLPHGLCLEWRPELIWLHAVSDGLTALAYYSIPFALLVFAYRRRDLSYRWMFVLFGIFILACGTTHIMAVWTLWDPIYGLQGVVKGVTAIASLATAVLLWGLLPRALALPGPREWRRVNDALEDRVRERTAALEVANAALRAEIALRAAIEDALRHAKDDAEAARLQAEQANADKSRFLAAASHDLRQPVQALFLFAEVLARQATSHAEQAVLGNFNTSLRALRSLLDSLLDVSKLDAGMITPQAYPVALGPLMETVAADHAAAAQAKGVALRVVPCSVEVASDADLLARILHNLVHNAVRYTPSGRILVGCRRRRDWVSIEVHDTGIGIPQQHLTDIFTEFFQVGNQERDREKGLGLGLAIAGRLAKLLGHAIEVRSQEGRGACFRVMVPLAMEGADSVVGERESGV